MSYVVLVNSRRCRGCGRRILLWRRRWAHKRCAAAVLDTQRTVSALMDAAPAWREWLEWQLHLLDLNYDPHHWITTESIR